VRLDGGNHGTRVIELANCQITKSANYQITKLPNYQITRCSLGGPLELGGVFSVLPTPFAADGSVDTASLRKVVDLFVAAGVDGVTALGVTSEVARLDERERQQVLETVTTHAAGRVKVVAGATADGLRTCIQYCTAARDAGAAAVMISPPRMPKLNSDAVLRHFSEVAKAVDIPIVVQDYPPISGYAMEAWLLARIAREVPAARTIKLEDPPTPFKTARILEQARVPPGRTDGRGGGRDDRIRVSGGAGPDRAAVPRRQGR
jgi:4-hydroxy-tetrahydrodipicolinate synthase